MTVTTGRKRKSEDEQSSLLSTTDT
jgi:hypothetical protein